MSDGLLPVEEALRIVTAAASPRGVEEVGLDAALGRVLAEDVVAPTDLPACDRSAMDGYAVRAADLGALPADLEVVGFLPAGRPAGGIELGPGKAVRIMTGAPVPEGADAVQMLEKTQELEGGRRVRFLEGVKPRDHLFVRGEDIRRGTRMLEAGRAIRPVEVGALAAVGKVRILVRRRPLARLLSTGDEVVDPSAEAQPHQVRNSNGPTLLGLMAGCGLDPVSLGIARDDASSLDERIAEGLSGDLFFLIGGVSVGDRDLVSERLRAAGVEVLFHRVAIKPGKPLLFGRRGACLVFGLPGNPLSSFTDFLVFALPAIRKMSGLASAGLPEIRARLAESLRQKPGRAWYRLAKAAIDDGTGLEVRPVSSTGSGDLVSATRANCFVIVPAETSLIEAGQEARVLLWPGFDVAT